MFLTPETHCSTIIIIIIIIIMFDVIVEKKILMLIGLERSENGLRGWAND